MRVAAIFALAVTLTAACRGAVNARPETACATPRIDTRGWVDDSGSAFRLRLPRGLQRQRAEGVDSEVGRWVGAGGAVSYDYGWYSNDLTGVEAPEAQGCETTIGGRRARVVTFRLPGGAYGAAAHWPGSETSGPPGQRNALTVTTEAPDSVGRQTMLAVLHSVRFRDR